MEFNARFGDPEVPRIETRIPPNARTISALQSNDKIRHMEKYHIALTDEERVLVQAITLRLPKRAVDKLNEIWSKNARPILDVLDLLTKRNAIPEVRLKYWNDPEYQTDRRYKTSNKGLFERKGCTGEDIYTHLRFLRYLRYFLFGADLQNEVISRFEEKVGNPDWVTSGDIGPISKCARDLTRKFDLDRSRAPEEFYKLCLDMGLPRYIARLVMESVKKAR